MRELNKWMRRTCLLMILMIIGSTAYGQMDYLKGVGIVDHANLVVRDNGQLSQQEASTSSNEPGAMIVLRFKNFAHTKFTEAFTIDVPITCTIYDHDFQTRTDNFTLSLGYDPEEGKASTDKAAYLIKGTPLLISSEIQDISSGSEIIINDIKDHLILEQRMLIKKDSPHGFNSSSQVSNPDVETPSENSNDLYFTWSDHPNASGYELAWYLASDELKVNEQWLIEDMTDWVYTTVETSESNYRITAPIGSGDLYYRIRPYKDLNGTRIFGKSVFKIKDDYSYQFEENRNWSYSVAYSSQGKKAEAIAYTDGLGKVRQQVARNPEDQTVTVSEQFYDYDGVPTVQMLPGIVSGQKLEFYEEFTLNSSNVQYNKTNFATDTKVVNPDPIQSKEGVHNNYFSPQNEFIGDGTSEYVPNAENYPFTVTQFDSEGRIKEVTGMGSDYNTESGRSTKINYTTPSQEKLNLFFGNDAGDNKHYTQIKTTDINGQKRLAYYNKSGQVIATSMIGDEPTHLDTLAEDTLRYAKQKYLQVDFLKARNAFIEDELSYISEYSLNVTIPQNYQFEYVLTRNEYESLCNNPAGNCVYDLELFVETPQGAKIIQYLPAPGQTSTISDASFDANNEFRIPAAQLQAYLLEGVYRVYRKLTLNEEALELAADNYELHLRSGNASVCIDPLDSNRIDSIFQILDPDDCESPLGPTAADIVVDCEGLKYMLLNDMSPGGTYFDNIRPLDENENINAWLNDNVADNPDDAGIDVSNLPENTWDALRENWFEEAAQSLIGEHPEVRMYQWCEATKDIDGFVNDLLKWKYADISAHIDVANGSTNTLHTIDPLDGSSSYSFGGEEVLDLGDLSTEEEFGYFLTNAGSGRYTDVFKGQSGGNAIQSIHQLAVSEMQDYLTATGSSLTSDNEIYWHFYRQVYMVLRYEFVNKLRKDFFPGLKAQNYNPEHNPLDGAQVIVAAAGVSNCDANGNTREERDQCRAEGHELLFPDIETDITDYAMDNRDNLLDLADQWHPGDIVKEETSVLIPFSTDPNSINNGEIPEFSTLTAGLVIKVVDPANCGMVKSLFSAPHNVSGWTLQQIANAIDGDPNDGITAVVQAPSGILITMNPGISGKVMASFQYSGPASYDIVCGDIGIDFGIWAPNDVIDYDIPPNHCLCSSIEAADEWWEYAEQQMALGFVQWSDWGYTSNPTKDEHLLEGVELRYGRYDEAADKYYFTDENGNDVELTESLVTQYKTNCSSYGVPSFGTPYVFKEFNCGEFDPEQECLDFKWDLAKKIANDDYEKRIAELVGIFKEKYIDRCFNQETFNNRKFDEQFKVDFEDKEYHYTLYIYDLVGNLVATISPEAFRYPTAAQWQQIQDYQDGVVGVAPLHWSDIHNVDLATRFTYNSLGQTLTQSDPDDGNSTFYYDKFGRLLLSQNAEQAKEDNGTTRYSYTLFDDKERLKESGEVELPVSQPVDQAFTQSHTSASFGTFVWIYPRNEVTTSVYGESIENYTRNRIEEVSYKEKSTDSQSRGYRYTYDIYGNAIKTVQFDERIDASLTGLAEISTEYTYDLLSGNVLDVVYQRNKEDQLFTRFEYDYINRLREVHTSTDGYLWNRDASYDFYKHGALARVELGEYQVQGLDFAYTLQGQLKAINGGTLTASRDIGKDGILAGERRTLFTGVDRQRSEVARDAFGYVLGYYKAGVNEDWGDYHPVATLGSVQQNHFEPKIVSGSVLDQQSKDYYDGNISYTISAIYDKPDAQSGFVASPQINTYNYDALNRLTEMQAFTSASVISSNQWDAAGLDLPTGQTAKEYSSYYAKFSYDENGNLLHLKRNGKNTSGQADHYRMDDLSYYYDGKDDEGLQTGLLKSNRLYHVKDNIFGDSYGEDFDQTTAFNVSDVKEGNLFEYDELGNIIRDNTDGKILTWTAARKVKTIGYKVYGPGRKNIEFFYDAMGRRIGKLIKEHIDDPNQPGTFTLEPQSAWEYIAYAYSGSGVLMATYRYDYAKVAGQVTLSTPRLRDHMLYGASRLGVIDHQETPISGVELTEVPDIVESKIGKRRYELVNHLGNVMTVISDKKNVVFTSSPSTTFSTSFDQQDRYSTTGSYGDHWMMDEFGNGFVQVTSSDQDMYLARPIVKAGEQINVQVDSKIDGPNPFVELRVVLETEAGQQLYLDQNVLLTARSFVSMTNSSWATKNLTTAVPTVLYSGYNQEYDQSKGIRARVYVSVMSPNITVSLDQLSVTVNHSDAEYYYEPEILSSTDYYPYGSVLPGRGYKGSDPYRYGYNGMEKDDEVKGSGNHYTTPFRQYDPRLGRWFSPDPIFQPYQSPYTSMDCNPIFLNDPMGLSTSSGGGGDPEDMMSTSTAKNRLGRVMRKYGDSDQYNISASNQTTEIDGEMTTVEKIVVTSKETGEVLYSFGQYTNFSTRSGPDNTLVLGEDVKGGYERGDLSMPDIVQAAISGWTTALDNTQLALDVVGMLPGLGEVADGVNALISLGRGDYTGAAIAAASMVPIWGWFMTAGKALRKGSKYADEAVEAASEVAEHVDDAVEEMSSVYVGSFGGSHSAIGFDNLDGPGRTWYHLMPDGAAINKGRKPLFSTKTEFIKFDPKLMSRLESKIDYRKISVSKDQFNEMLKTAGLMHGKKNLGPYSRLGNSCVTPVKKILKSGGIKLGPSTVSPNGVLKSLEKKGIGMGCLGSK